MDTGWTGVLGYATSAGVEVSNGSSRDMRGRSWICYLISPMLGTEDVYNMMYIRGFRV